MKVLCHLKDCVYYNACDSLGDRQHGYCDCSHPEKHQYMSNAVCPLYKKNWANQQAASLAERFNKKKRFG